MAVIINASTTTGLVQSADTSGIITLQNNGTNAVTITSGNLQFNSGYGSVATAYGCRAWVNFDGTGTPSIRSSGNVSSITDVATGSYIVNFTTAMPDANYSTVGSTFDNGVVVLSTFTTSSVSLATRIIQVSSFPTGQPTDYSIVCASIFR